MYGTSEVVSPVVLFIRTRSLKENSLETSIGITVIIIHGQVIHRKYITRKVYVIK